MSLLLIAIAAVGAFWAVVECYRALQVKQYDAVILFGVLAFFMAAIEYLTLVQIFIPR